MVARKRFWVALAAASLLGSYSLGRFTRPRPAVHDTSHQETHSASAQAIDTTNHTVTKVVTRTVYLKPDGTSIQRDRVSVTGSEGETHSVSAATSATLIETTHDVTPHADPSWNLSLSLRAVNVSPNGLDLHPQLSLQADGRIWGPLWVWAELHPPILGQPLAVDAGLRLQLSF